VANSALNSSTRDWLSLGPASRLLGVDPDTLRRWADDGRIEAFVTPGGHRRFDRRSVEQLAAARSPVRQPIGLLGATPERIARAYRRSYRAGVAQDRKPVIEAHDRAAFREHGRLLVETLLTHLDATTSVARKRTEADAMRVVDEIARRLAANGTSLTDAVELFVGARRPFLSELGAIGRRRTLDPARLATMYDSASSLLDRLLLRLIVTHQGSAAEASTKTATSDPSQPLRRPES
jgi:excisionase family DNA binding protein